MSWYFPASFYQSCAHLPCLHPVSRPPQDEASLSQQGTEHRHSLLMPGRALWTEFIGQTARDLKELRPDILVEGEIGDIGSGSQIHDSAPHRPLTTPDEAMQFVQETAIDTLAPAVGNMHGVLKSMLSGDARKHLNIERIRAIKVVAARLALFSGRESQT